MDEEIKFTLSSKGGKMPYTVVENDKCYTWSNYGIVKRLVGGNLVRVACTGCRAIKDSGEIVEVPKRTYNPSTNKWINDDQKRHVCEPKNFSVFATYSVCMRREIMFAISK